MNRTWHAGLRPLGPVLRDEAIATPGTWAWRQLPRGAVVSCRVHPEYHALQFRIARATRPGLAERERWQQELRVFETYLQLAGWQKSDAPTASGGVEARYLSPERVLFGEPSAHAAATGRRTS